MTAYLAKKAMSAGMVSQSNPFTRKKTKPHKPSDLIQFFKFFVFQWHPADSNFNQTISLAPNDTGCTSLRTQLQITRSCRDAPLQVAAAPAALGSTGSPAFFHAAQPPARARAFSHPACRSSCATRALVASFGQAQ